MGLKLAKPNTKGQRSRKTNRIPSIDGIESFSAAAWVMAVSDVIDAIPVQPGFVQPVVEKAERFLAG